MGFHLPQTLFINLALVLLIVFAFTPPLSSTTPPTYNFPIVKPTCIDHCGNISIPYPFGTTEHCYQSYSFWVTCNHTDGPPKLFVKNSSIEITSIYLTGQLKVLQFVGYICYARNGSEINSNNPGIRFADFTVNNTANKITIVGCDAYGYVYGKRFSRNFTTGCTAMCEAKDDLVEGSCMGLGCCQTSIPPDVSEVDIKLYSYSNYTKVWNVGSCSYGFVADKSAFNFSSKNLTNLKNVEELPMVVDWAIGNGICEEAMTNSSTYACKGPHSKCDKLHHGRGYRCRCEDGFDGNPYLDDGCQDIDECKTPELSKCEYGCVNTKGSFYCRCPKWFHRDGRKGGDGCSRGESFTLRIVAGLLMVL